MRILEVNKYFYMRRGAERHFLDVIHLLRKHGHEVEVFSMQHKENNYEHYNEYFVSYVGYNFDDSSLWQKLAGAGRLFWSFQARRKMKALLEEWTPQVVHLHNIYHQLSPSILGPIKERGIPIAMTVHDYNLVSPDKDSYHSAVGQQFWKFLFFKKYSFPKRLLLVIKMYWNRLFAFYEKNIDAYIVPSQYVKNTLVEAGMEEKKIHVIPHFISLAERKSEKGALLPEHFPEKPFGLYFGSLTEEKGVDTLVNIFNTLEIPLVVIGNSERGYVPPYSEYVKVIGRLPKSEIEEWITHASAVVSASPLPETFGLIALESIALGKPFFGLTVGAFPEIIQNGENGILSKDIAGLRMAVKRFFGGEITFDGGKIQKDALTRFSDEKYRESLEAIFKTLHVKK